MRVISGKIILGSDGDWPSGKATGSGPVIGGSNPSSPAKKSDMSANTCHFSFISINKARNDVYCRSFSQSQTAAGSQP